MGTEPDPAATKTYHCCEAASASGIRASAFEGQIDAEKGDHGLCGKFKELALWVGGIERRVGVNGLNGSYEILQCYVMEFN